MTRENQSKCHEETLAKLVCNLQSNTSLCRLEDYAGVSLQDLNLYIDTNGPLLNPLVGLQEAFNMDDDDRVVPYRIFEPTRSATALEIAVQLRLWARHSGHGGGVVSTLGQARGCFLDDSMVRMPDVAYMVQGAEEDQLTNTQRTWTHEGHPFVPSFVVEVDTLAGPGSRLEAYDQKMRNEYFPHGVLLAWLVDPYKRLMYEYKVSSGEVVRVVNTEWRDLEGGDVVPGFQLCADSLDLALTNLTAAVGPPAPSPIRFDAQCPYPGCNERLTTAGYMALHMMRHSDDEAIAEIYAEEQQQTE